jgi:hypothetical protein
MNKYSKLNLRNIVVEVFNTEESIETVEAQRGGIWAEYFANNTEGSLGKLYNPEYDIFCDPRPIDINGLPCNSWNLDTTSGKYLPPVESPGATTKRQDDKGLCWYWDEKLHESDKTSGWILTSK